MSITIEQAAEWFEKRAKEIPMPGTREMHKIAAAALREKAEREDPKPLTWDELRQMVGEPVYCVCVNGHSGWNFVETKKDGCVGLRWDVWPCPMPLRIYRHKPKEVQENA